MAERGRILHHLRNNIEDSKTVILFVGYEAENWLAHRIMYRNGEVTIFREPFRDALLEN
jgi:metallo-beta-lactamase family protein